MTTIATLTLIFSNGLGFHVSAFIVISAFGFFIRMTMTEEKRPHKNLEG